MFRPPDTDARLLAQTGIDRPIDEWRAEFDRASDWRALKDHPGGTVWRVTLFGQDCVCKCTPLTSLKRRLQARFGATPLIRQFRNANLLTCMGIDTAAPIVLIRGSSSGHAAECLVTECVEGRTVLDHLDDPEGVRQQHRIAASVGAIAAKLAGEQIANRDPKPSNLLVRSADARDAQVAVIDCADFRRARRDSVARSLASAFIEPLGCGLAPRRALAMRAVATAADTLDPTNSAQMRRELWNRARSIVEAHADPTPEHDPRRRPFPSDP